MSRIDDQNDELLKYAPKRVRNGKGKPNSTVVVRFPQGSPPVQPDDFDKTRWQNWEQLPLQQSANPSSFWRNNTSFFDEGTDGQTQPFVRTLPDPEFVAQPPEVEPRPLQFRMIALLSASVVLAAVVALVLVVVIPAFFPKAAQQSMEARNNKFVQPPDVRSVAASSSGDRRVVVDSGKRVVDKWPYHAMKAANGGNAEIDSRLPAPKAPSIAPPSSAPPVQQPAPAGMALAATSSVIVAPPAATFQNTIAPAPTRLRQSFDLGASAIFNAEPPGLGPQFEKLVAEQRPPQRQRSEASAEKRAPADAVGIRQKSNKRPYRQKKRLSAEDDNGG